MSDDVVRINTGVSMGRAEQREIVEIPRAEWDALTSEQQEKRLEEMAEEMISNEVDAWAYVEDEGSGEDE
jgi:hypothetical protein